MNRILIAAIAASLLSVLAGCGDSEPGKESPEAIGPIVEHFNQGVGLMEQYRPAEAVESFEKVVEMAPGWIEGRLNLGLALMNAQTDEFFARAEEELERVIAEEPDNPFAHYALGILFSRLGRRDEARARFESVLEFDPGDPDTHYQLGNLAEDKDPDAARNHFEKTLEKIPHHESACYRLMNLLRQAGEKERAGELLERFKSLKSTGAGIISGIKYGEMGRYAEVVRCLDRPDEVGTGSSDLPSFIDAAEKFGLDLAAAGTPGWPVEGGSFAPGVGVADIDGDCDLDLYITGAGPEQAGALLVNENGRYSALAGSGIDGTSAIGAYFGDYDADGNPDLYLTCAGPNRLYRNDGQGVFTDVTTVSGTAGGQVLSVGAAWADADHDGDLDLYVANFGPRPVAGSERTGAPNNLWRNNGNGSFTDMAIESGIDGGAAATMAAVFFDVDDDRDVDLYVVNDRSANQLFLNHRVGRYSEATALFGEIGDEGPGTGAVVGDVDQNGREDLLLLRGPEPARLFLKSDRGRFDEDHAFGAAARDAGGAVGGLMGDLDLDGDLDLVLLGAGESARSSHLVFMNRGVGKFGAPGAIGDKEGPPDARGAVAADVDDNGSLELLVARAGARPELWQAPAPEGSHWLQVVPATRDDSGRFSIENTAVGTHVEIKSMRRLQVGRIVSSAGYLGNPPPMAHFGLGSHRKADYVRLLWSDSVLQSELEVAADEVWMIAKMARKPSSCPILFSWDGERFAYVTDFLGVGGLGFFIAPGEYGPPDPDEDVRIPPELIAPRDGRILLRIAEPLEEISYIDQLSLRVYDHPAEWEVYPDERFAVAEPFPTARPIASSERLYPVAAKNHLGDDVLERILEKDRHYFEPPKDRRFVGYADDHWIELDFGATLSSFDEDARLVLFLYGWVEYTYSHVNYAAYQAAIAMRAPSIEVPDGNGGWRVAMADVGYPAGLPRMMTLDISSLPVREQGRMRIRTNMEIFWDEIFVAEDVAEDTIRSHTLEADVALLRGFGYPREFSPDGNDPTVYDYHRVDQGVPFKNMTGNYTPLGDVRPLLKSVDDLFVIMPRGEEIALEFDVTGLPALPKGWTRTYVLHSDGYCKDMDLYTAFPDTVGPLPYHGMENYPPETPAPREVEERNRLHNTRPIAGQ